MAAATPQATETIHATTIALEDRALLLLGPSGSGKSATALHMISLGATLVADDRTVLTAEDGTLWASPAPNLAGRIEARHMGLLTLPHLPRAPAVMAVDLATAEKDRLPTLHDINFLGIVLPLYRRVDGPHFVPTLLHCLTGHRSDPS